MSNPNTEAIGRLKKATEAALEKQSFIKNSPIMMKKDPTKVKLYAAQEPGLKLLQVLIGKQGQDDIEWAMETCSKVLNLKATKTLLVRRAIQLFKDMLIDLIIKGADINSQQELLDFLEALEVERFNILEAGGIAAKES